MYSRAITKEPTQFLYADLTVPKRTHYEPTQFLYAELSLRIPMYKTVQLCECYTTRIYYRERAYENERFYGCFALLLLTEIRKIQISVRIQISAAAGFSAGWLRISATSQRLRNRADDKGCTLAPEFVPNYSHIT